MPNKIECNDSITKDNCDYIAYVDASGDDGFKFGEKSEGSSVCYCVCMFLSKQEHIPHNLEVLEEIKKEIGCKPEHELKYTTMRRHKNSQKAHQLLKKLRGTVVSWIAFKKDITDVAMLDTKNKLLSKFCHVFPIESINNILKHDPNKKIFIAVDVMKKCEMDGVSDLLTGKKFDFGFYEGQPVIESYNLKFRDSKDKDFKLLQVADIISGVIRSGYEDFYFNKTEYPKCHICFNSGKRRALRPKCIKQYKGKIRNKLQNLFLLEDLFLKDDKRDILMNGLTPYPFKFHSSLCFLDCFQKK